MGYRREEMLKGREEYYEMVVSELMNEHSLSQKQAIFLMEDLNFRRLYEKYWFEVEHTSIEDFAYNLFHSRKHLIRKD